ncbi:hypothetical protein TNCV_3952781 [Trichonephila clavipes]|nr:hypothetical protein TNCV_3952781 [Trichonephila clavipes]
MGSFTFNIAGNEIADALAKDGATEFTMKTRPLSPIENCTPPTLTISNRVFLLLITGMRLFSGKSALRGLARPRNFEPKRRRTFQLSTENALKLGSTCLPLVGKLGLQNNTA